jgi:hypothetical protein
VVTELLAAQAPKHPCAGVVGAQGTATEWRQVPEPWSGSLERAKVLAVVSHPVLHERDLRPVWRSTWDHTERFFERRLVGDGPQPRVSPGAVGRRLRVDDPGGLPTDPELVAAVERTTELLGRVPSLLHELAVTHVVRCPTTGDLGVNRAMKSCPDRWLRQVVNACPAPVLLAVGANADKGLSRVLGLFPGGTARVTEVVVDGVRRMVVVVPHPQGPGGARPLEELLGDQLLAVRDLLGAALTGPQP